jgi:hypothetical protein
MNVMICKKLKVSRLYVVSTMYLSIKSHPDSLEKVERKGQIVKIVGRGVMKSPGHPAGHQVDYRQYDIFNTSCRPPYTFTLYKDNEFLGQYIMLNHTIKLSFEGFRYYEFTLSRVSYNMLYEDLEVLDD